ncbi:MAG: lipoyl(octanoyl) transferase LipB [Myxococcota bacterium]
MRFVWWPGPVSYADGHAAQQRLVDARLRDDAPDTVLLLEHADTITVGRARGAAANVLDAGGIPVVAVERGGDTTWHGPGQLVAYPIVRLTRPDLHAHLHALEDAVIAALGGQGLAAGRDPRNTGVWIAGRKVCSVGIACRRWVTWHGLALNVDPDLARFARIRPCGFEPDVMTRVADHLAPCPPVSAWVQPVADALADAFGRPRAAIEPWTEPWTEAAAPAEPHDDGQR